MLQLVIVLMVSIRGLYLLQKIILLSGNLPKDKSLIIFHPKPSNSTNQFMSFTITLNIMPTLSLMIAFQVQNSTLMTKIYGKVFPRKL